MKHERDTADYQRTARYQVEARRPENAPKRPTLRNGKTDLSGNYPLGERWGNAWVVKKLYEPRKRHERTKQQKIVLLLKTVPCGPVIK